MTGWVSKGGRLDFFTEKSRINPFCVMANRSGDWQEVRLKATRSKMLLAKGNCSTRRGSQSGAAHTTKRRLRGCRMRRCRTAIGSRSSPAHGLHVSQVINDHVTAGWLSVTTICLS